MVSFNGRKKLLLQMQWCFNTVLVLFVLFCASSSAFAACHTVTPSGSGSQTGADWNNAYAGIPATLTRGDIYYLADGSYPAYTFSEGASGTTTVELRKAQSYDNCTATGWSTGAMGSAQAKFSGNPAIRVNGPYFTMNGNGNSTASGCGGAPGTSVTSEPPTPSDCGISLAGSGGTTSGALNVISLGSSNAKFNYVELVASGTNNIGGSGSLEVFGAGSGGYLTITHMYARNSGCVYVQDIGTNSLIDHSYFWGTEVYGAPGSEACHGQAEFESGGTNNGVRSDNVYRDITGTAVWTFAAGAGTNNNWQFYNNVVFFSSPQNSFGGLTDAVLDCINSGVECTNFTFVQNTISNCLANGVFGAVSCGIMFENGNGSYIAENNLWYSNPSGRISFCCSGTSITEDYNSFLNNSASPGSGAHDVNVASGAPDPFANWQGSNFNLTSDNADWNSRLALGSPYTTDVNGTTFTSDRGAYQSTVAGSAPAPPTGLSAVVQ
jgi:hypothetical protein